MKRTILLIALLLVGLVSMAQNYIGKTLNSVKLDLDKKGIQYETYVNVSGRITINYDVENENRKYTFDYDDVCYQYLINFTDPEKVYEYGKKYNAMKWRKIQGYSTSDEYDMSLYWVFKYQQQTATCVYKNDTEEYNIIVIKE